MSRIAERVTALGACPSAIHIAPARAIVTGDAAYVHEWGEYATSSEEGTFNTSVRSRRLLLSAIYRHGGR